MPDWIVKMVDARSYGGIALLMFPQALAMCSAKLPMGFALPGPGDRHRIRRPRAADYLTGAEAKAPEVLQLTAAERAVLQTRLPHFEIKGQLSE